jgi:hypothetical protein
MDFTQPCRKLTEDLSVLVTQYPRALGDDRGIDFERLSHDIDAMYLTRKGYLRTRSLLALHGWGYAALQKHRHLLEARRGTVTFIPTAEAHEVRASGRQRHW